MVVHPGEAYVVSRTTTLDGASIAFAILYSHWFGSGWIEVKLYTESYSRLREASTWKSSVRSLVDVSRKVREQDGNLMSQISCDGELCLNNIRGNIDLMIPVRSHN